MGCAGSSDAGGAKYKDAAKGDAGASRTPPDADSTPGKVAALSVNATTGLKGVEASSLSSPPASGTVPTSLVGRSAKSLRQHDTDTMIKISNLMQKLSEARGRHPSQVQVLKSVLDAIAQDCSASYACVQTINNDSSNAMIMTSVGAPMEFTEKYRLQNTTDAGTAVAIIVSSNAYTEWTSTSTEPTPTDWEVLVKSKELVHIAAVPITVGPLLIGILTLGVSTEDAADAVAWPVYMQLVASTINCLIKDNILKYMAVIEDVRAVPEVDTLMHKLVGHLQKIVGQGNQHIWYRLALANNDLTCATIFDDFTQLPPANQQSASSRLVQITQANGGVMRSVINMKNTVMKISMTNRQQVMIPDVQKLTNQSGYVSIDIFNTRLMKPPTSLLVFPLKVKHGVYGVIFCMSPVQTDFAEMSTRLKELCEVMSSQLLQSLTQGTLRAEYQAIRDAIADINGSMGGSIGGGSLLGKGIAGELGSGSMGTGSFKDMTSMMQSLSTTGALVTGLTEKLNQKRMKSAMDFSSSKQLEGLQVQGLLGEGGFAKVFKGLWQGMVVAVKIVVDDGANEKNVLKNAHEIAILSTLSHPHVTLAYLSMTDVMVRSLMESISLKAEDEGATQAIHAYLQENEERSCHVEVLEFCDLGSLLGAIRHKTFMAPAASAASRASGCVAVPEGHTEGVDMHALVLTLVEVASALDYLHRMGVVHCDIKPANVLLKSSNNDPRGFTAKVSDFGLSRVEDDGTSASFPFNSCGTAAYVAPEALTCNRKVTSSVDVYAFGILMWELFTGLRPYGNTKQQQLVEEVVMRGLRPTFPPHTPPNYKQLAQECWSGAPAQRPTFKDVLLLLNTMLDAMDGRASVTRDRSSNSSASQPAFRSGSSAQPQQLQQQRSSGVSSPQAMAPPDALPPAIMGRH
ncbi:hypothetical protein FOA52_005906 [Chlamydomonas sp. UWO 241]|nr:hypothetical protein FOA52_005906 [Chlamydomonas sp. UWO 241]